jgi:ribonuclease I
MLSIQPDLIELPQYMLTRHYYRKHGAGAYFTNDDYGAGMINR